MLLGEYDRAAQLLERTIPVLQRERASAGSIGLARERLARAYLGQGRTDQALLMVREAIPDLRRIDYTLPTMCWLVLLHEARGDWRRLVLVYGYAEREGERYGWAQRPSERRAIDRALLRACDALGDTEVGQQREEGRNLADDTATDMALAEEDRANA